MEENGLSLEPIKDKDKLPAYQDDMTGKPLGLEAYQPATQFGYLKIDHETGDVEYTLTGEKRKSWKVVIANFTYSRIMFDKDLDNRTPICKTKDRLQNQLDLEGTEYGRCATCDYAKWEGQMKPPCNLNLNFSGLIEGNLVTPVGITMSGGNFKTGTQLLEWFRKNGVSPWAVVLEVTTKGPFTKGRNKWYSFDFKQAGITPKDVADQLAAMYIESGGMPVFAVEESVSEEVSDKPATTEEMEDILLNEIDEKADDNKPPF